MLESKKASNDDQIIFISSTLDRLGAEIILFVLDAPNDDRILTDPIVKGILITAFG